jgi:hypothetical protein
VCRRGEFVKSSSSILEPPVVRAVRAEFGSVSEGINPEASIDPELYGHSAETSVADQGSTGTFAAELAQGRRRSATRDTARVADWRPPILCVLLEEVVIRQWPEHLEKPKGAVHSRWELKKAERLNALWAEARLNGLSGDDAEVIKWIRVSDGQRPEIATDLASGDITPEEAALHIGYGGRIDTRWPTIYARFHDGHINRSEAIAFVRRPRQNHRTA